MNRILLLFVLLTSVALFAQDPWNHRGNPNWDRSWNDRPAPRAGACFYKEQGFRGDHFCVTRGDRLDRLPGSFGDNISSVQLFGGARVMVYNDRNFTGGNAE